MEDWVLRALEKWPNVPALYGWLGLDRRGRWLIRGEPITRPQIIDTINPNYAADERGCWYFQNGPQRGYVTLEYAPLVLHVDGDGQLSTHTGRRVEQPEHGYFDEHGSLLLKTEHGPGVLADKELFWAHERLYAGATTADDEQLAVALALPSGAATALQLRFGGTWVPLSRLDCIHMPQRLGFVRNPGLQSVEASQTGQNQQ